MPMKTMLDSRAGPAGHLAVAQRAHPVDDLVHDLGGGQIAVQTRLPGRAERAVHPAARPASEMHMVTRSG